MQITTKAKPIICSAICFSFTLLVEQSAAQGDTTNSPHIIETGEVRAPNSRQFLFSSNIVDDSYQIDVIEANPPNISADKLPVVFVLGDSLALQSARSSATLLSFDGIIPSTLIVGIGYSGLNGPQGPLRDYTPTFNEAFLAQVSGEPELGGADTFLAFINEELKPFIAKEFPSADLADTTVVGHSLSGLFALHVLTSQPSSFQRYVVASPSLWWDDEVTLKSANLMRAHSAQVFLAYGELEPSGLMHGPVERMHELLRSREWPNFGLSRAVFSGVGHGSVIPLAQSQGLRTVFAADSN